jgi:hypothetical protein
MTGYRLSFNDQLRCLALAAVYVTYSALALFLMVALLTDWPEMLHRVGARLGPW